MILTVTLNAALDVTYRIDQLRPQGGSRVRATAERAGGKGVSVAASCTPSATRLSSPGWSAGSPAGRSSANSPPPVCWSTAEPGRWSPRSALTASSP
ncbi:hypothetical protein ABZX88_29525 [Kitasatospora aureofaciens]|uniref:hypothetical protein n=1 Tax=Kitasatospora aureofaciens TaxID=1894 RepID=UPI0033B8D74E